MKRFFALLMALSLLAALVGCAGQTEAPTAGRDDTAESAPEPVAPAAEDTENTDDTEEAAPVPAFETKDLDGNTVTNDIFTEKDVTVVNIWGTFCQPCINEMPELGEWELPDNAQLIGIVADLPLDGDDAIRQQAVEILDRAGASFRCLEVDEGLASLLQNVVGVPTTFLVDSQGCIIGEPILGAYVSVYQQAVEDYLNAAS